MANCRTAGSALLSISTCRRTSRLVSFQLAQEHVAGARAASPTAIGGYLIRPLLFPSRLIFHKPSYRTLTCSSNIEMTPLCKVDVTLPRILGSRGMRRGGGVDEQAGVQPA